MTELITTVEHAARSAGRGAAPAPEWNPVYRALIDELGPASAPAAPDLDGSRLELVVRQLTSRALLVVAVTVGERTRRLRIGLAPSSATLERADGDGPSHWREIDLKDVPAAITTALEDAGVDLAPPQLSVERRPDALRLFPEQGSLARAALVCGLPAEDAFASVPDLGARLRDALTAPGPRISLALTLHDSHGRITERPVSWSRLWARGRLGLYRLDRPATPALEVHPVGCGDVLGTVLPILEEGIRFTAACAASGGAR